MKNIIFDIGNILLKYQPKDYLLTLYSKQVTDDLMTIIFQNPLWIELDRGTYTTKEVQDKMICDYPQYHQEIAYVMQHWTDLMIPILENVEIALMLKEKGYHIYLLSNFHYEAFEKMKKKYSFFNQFDGGIISGYEHLIKPQKEIYELLLNRYQLKADDCLFIDDVLDNIIAARKEGIHGLHLPYSYDLKEELKKSEFYF